MVQSRMDPPLNPHLKVNDHDMRLEACSKDVSLVTRDGVKYLNVDGRNYTIAQLTDRGVKIIGIGTGERYWLFHGGGFLQVFPITKQVDPLAPNVDDVVLYRVGFFTYYLRFTEKGWYPAPFTEITDEDTTPAARNTIDATEVEIVIRLPQAAKPGQVVLVNLNQQSIFLGDMWYTNTDPSLDLQRPIAGQLLVEEGKPTWMFDGNTWMMVQEKRTINAKVLLRLQQESMSAADSMEEFARLINRYFHQE